MAENAAQELTVPSKIDLKSIKYIQFGDICEYVVERGPLSGIKGLWQKYIEAPGWMKWSLIIAGFAGMACSAIFKNVAGGFGSIFVALVGCVAGAYEPSNRCRKGRWNGLIASLSDSAWSFLQRNAERARELGERVRAFNARIGSLRDASAMVSTYAPDELAATCEQLIRERSVLAPEAEEFLAELKVLIDKDLARKRLLMHYDDLDALERRLNDNDSPHYRETRDVSALQIPIVSRERLDEERERLLLTKEFVKRAIKLKDPKSDCDVIVE